MSDPNVDNVNSDATTNNNNAAIHAKTQAQMEAIEKEIKENQPLTSSPLAVESLKAHYEDETASKHFALGIDVLCKRYQYVRKVRGDGNCYYRAFLFGLCEHLMDPQNKEELDRICLYAKESSQFVINVGGYDEFAIDAFYETLVELLESIQKGTLSTTEALRVELNQENATSEYCTWYMRVLTATYLKSDPSRFLPYLEDGYMDIAAFCQAQVEPMGKECTMVQVLALAEAFGVVVKVEYLDGRELSGDNLTQHVFGPDKAKLHLSLLYRPGHYDILYPKG